MRSLFPYIGGKHRIAGQLIKLFPEHTCYVEVFAGAANVLLAKPPSKVEALNDVNGDIVNIFRIIRWHPDELIKELGLLRHSRKEFFDYHDQPGLTDVQRAARHWYLLKTTFGGTGPAGHRNFSFGCCRKAMIQNDFAEIIEQVHERLNGVYIETGDFEKVIKRYDRPATFFFCDPPYWQAADHGVPFEWPDHERLAKTLRGLKGKFLLTINDHPDIRRLYKGLPSTKIAVCYTITKEKKKKLHEFVITNYKLPK
jgi:DNA adenine methylase